MMADNASACETHPNTPIHPGYVSRMKEDQKTIYYMNGLSRSEVETSPLIEGLLAEGYEVCVSVLFSARLT